MSILFFYACEYFQPRPQAPQPAIMSLEDSLALVRQQKFALTLEQSGDEIRTILENRLPGQRHIVENRHLFSSVLLPRFYTSRGFAPFWFKHSDSLQQASRMIEFIRSTSYHGLQSDDYHLEKTEELLSSLLSDSTARFDPVIIARLDMLLTDAWFMIASHLYNGKLDPEELTIQWGIQRNKPELMLDVRLAGFDGTDIDKLMQTFYPPHPGYMNMVAEASRISQLQEVAGVKFSNRHSPIKPGESSALMPQIRQRLALWEVYTADSLSGSEIYDENTVDAVKRLQHKFGYQTDGVIGRLTMNAINMSLEERLKALYTNMERLRWLPDSLEKRYVLVNIADFTLRVMEGNDTLLEMKTIVGKDYRETPVFNSRITYLVFSPSWTVPPGIQKADVIPATARNINYLKEKNMVVLNAHGQAIDPSTINWKRDGMRYIIRQAPGPQNALGRVKFMFPNKYNVYLHDTPSRELFARDERTFSSGCIRVEKPFELARLLLDDDPGWTEERIRQAMNSSSERTVVLRSQPGVYIYYLTAWADQNGNLQYRNDIYNRDAEIYAALQQKKPANQGSLFD
ncbi:MAG TPA: L,D-transpeptidase family protein [Bacteroidales bacterium]|nr:L,D-transpeptidase family protein [Bacteroidales bacterium]